jgi:ketosteroid isomerase-like protein
MTSLATTIENVNDAVGRRDFGAVSSLMHPDVVWEHNIGQGTPEEGVYRGRGPVVALLERIVEPWEYMRLDPSEIKELGHDRYVVRGEMHAKHRTTEAEIVTPYVQSLTFRDGLLLEGRFNMGDESANVSLVRRFVEAFNRRDVDSMDGYYDPDVELHEWPTAPGAQVYHGIEGVRSALDNWFEIWEWMRVEIVDLLDLGDRVLVTLDQVAKGKGSEIEVEIRSHNVYTFRDGKVLRMELFTEREPALEAAGLIPTPEEETR